MVSSYMASSQHAPGLGDQDLMTGVDGLEEKERGLVCRAQQSAAVIDQSITAFAVPLSSAFTARDA